MDDNDPKRFQVWTTGSDLNNTENMMQNESTTKLIQTRKDPFSGREETRYSIIRSTILILAINLNYANVVRFPREVERNGIGFLLPYLTMMFLIGVPIVLLEMSLGQFLGQNSVHSWKTSPLFRGASVMGRLGSFLGCLWISMQSSLILLYIGQLIFSQVPFPQCPGKTVINEATSRYDVVEIPGQFCLQKSFLRSIEESPASYGLLAVGVVFIWLLIMTITLSNRATVRSLIYMGFNGLALLIFQLGWQVKNQVSNHNLQNWHQQLWPFEFLGLKEPDLWFSALVQVLLSTQIGIGCLPVVTGKLLYKGDVIRMSSLYMCFNLLISTLAAAFFMTTFNEKIDPIFPDLTAITSIYDRAFIEPRGYLRSLIPGLAYLMIIFSAMISLAVAIYTLSHFVRQKPRYWMCLMPMLIAILCLLYPNFQVSQVLDFQWTGIFIICALIFEIIGTTWIYGTNALSTDLEFSVGRRINKIWIYLWKIAPVILALVLIVYTATRISIATDLIERWPPIIICIFLFIYFAIYESIKQIDYNFLYKIRGAALHSKDYGPADPVVRHAWKNWKDVCNGGYRDFTLRRRGTKDWTNSIKKGQYSHSKTENRTPVTRTSNYSESIFGDSAIEEDIGYEKFAASQSLNFDAESDHIYPQHSYQSIPIRISAIHGGGQVPHLHAGSSSAQNISFIQGQPRNPLYSQRNSFKSDNLWDQYPYYLNGHKHMTSKREEFSTEL